MKTLTLKAKSPTTLHVHPMPGQPEIPLVFSLDNDCRCEVPVEFWEEIQDHVFDGTNGIRYNEFFRPL